MEVKNRYSNYDLKTQEYMKILCDSIENEYGTIDMPLKQAILLMVGQLYRNRELSSELTFKELPKAYDYLLQPYRSYRYNH